MTTAYTPLLGLALPVTGELSGQWGVTVNDSITSLLDSAISGTTTLSSDVDVTLTTTQGAANTSREAIILWTAGGTVTRTITVPAQSKIYTVINKTSSTQSIKIVGAGPTTGVTIIAGESAVVAWNGVDFIKISNISGAGVFSSITNTGLTSGRVVYSTTGGLETDSANLTFNGTTLTANTLNLTNQLTTAYGGTGLTSYTAGDLPYYATGTALSKLGIGTSGQILTSSGTAPQWSTLSGVAVTTFSAGTTGLTPNSATSGAVTLAGTLATTNGGTGLTSFTANGVVYASSTSALATGSALTFDGATMALGQYLGANGRLNITTASSGTFQIATYMTNAVDTDFQIRFKTGISDIGTSTSTPLTFSYGGSEQMRLTSTGLGIGTSSPVSPLTVAGTASVNWAGPGSSTGTATIGTQGTGGSLLVQTPSVNASYASGFGVDGTYSGGKSVINLKALGTSSGGPYSADMAFFTSTNTTLSEKMRLDSSGNLGIGTSSPAQKLDVGGGTGTPAIRINGGSSTNTGPYLQFARGGTQTNIIGPYSSVASGTANDLTYYSASGYGHIWFSNGQASNINMQLDSAGNLGLGVTPSAWATYKALQVNTTGVFSNVSGTTRVGDNFYYDGSNYRYLTSSYVSMQQYNGGAGGFAWFNAPSGTAGNAITFTQAMTLDASGNLGVGTTSPVDKLQVEGNIYLGTTGRTIYQAGSADLTLQVNTGNIKFFRANGVSESARIDSSGNLLVGTTSANPYPTQGMSIYGNNGGSALIGMGHATGTASGNAYMTFAYNGTGIGSITQAGTTGVLYNVTSDQRLKENIQDADSASSLIDSLQVRKFDWKTDQTHQRYGFIAQELVTVAPEAVHQPADPEEMMAVDYSKLVPMLVKEIQSLRKRLADAGI